MIPNTKILITGANGLVASRVIQLLPSDYQLLTPDLNRFNLLNKSQITQFIKQNRPDITIHFAAYTNVSEAENQAGNKQDDCWQINVEGTRNLISALKANSYQPSANLIHISTDMVFPGAEDNPGPYTETHPLPIKSPINKNSNSYQLKANSYRLSWYGWCKLQAELLARQAGTTIVRLIYPVCVHPVRPDYLHKLYNQSQKYPLFDDQQISITYIDQLADALIKIIDLKASSQKLSANTFHISTPDTTTPYQLLKYTLEKLRQDTSHLKSSSLKDYLKTQPNPYRYPLKGGLNSDQTSQTLKIKFFSWQQVVNHLISQGLNFPTQS